MAEEKYSRRYELLLGVFIGLYGNWLVNLGQMLSEQGSSWLFFGVSLAAFLLFFLSVTHIPRIIGPDWFAFIGAVLHIVFIILSVTCDLTGLKNSSSFLSIGLLLWLMVSMAAMKL